jgi:ATP-dependent Clp protease ATP-binding subunit ClpA
LKNLDVDLKRVRLEVEKRITLNPNPVTKKPERNPAATTVLERAIQIARDLEHNYVGTEHLLLALLSDPDSISARVLTEFGLRLDEVREEALNILRGPVEESPPNLKVLVENDSVVIFCNDKKVVLSAQLIQKIDETDLEDKIDRTELMHVLFRELRLARAKEKAQQQTTS